jgi:hypothetical protein
MRWNGQAAAVVDVFWGRSAVCWFNVARKGPHKTGHHQTKIRLLTNIAGAQICAVTADLISVQLRCLYDRRQIGGSFLPRTQSLSHRLSDRIS